MDEISKYLTVFGLCVLFMLFSFRYAPLSDAINDPNYVPMLDSEEILDISAGSIRETFKDDSTVVRKILAYGMEQYLDIWEYPFCTVNRDIYEDINYWLQLTVSFVFTGWMFFAFQKVTDVVAYGVSHDTNGKEVGFAIKMSYTFLY